MATTGPGTNREAGVWVITTWLLGCRSDYRCLFWLRNQLSDNLLHEANAEFVPIKDTVPLYQYIIHSLYSLIII